MCSLSGALTAISVPLWITSVGTKGGVSEAGAAAEEASEEPPDQTRQEVQV